MRRLITSLTILFLTLSAAFAQQVRNIDETVLIRPDGSAEVREEKAEANRLTPGNCDYYRCGEYLLQLYSDADGTLVSVMLTE